MYSQNPTHFNTVFLITLFVGFLPCSELKRAQYAASLRGVMVDKCHKTVCYKASGYGADAGDQNSPEDQTRKQDSGPDMTTVEFHF